MKLWLAAFAIALSAVPLACNDASDAATSPEATDASFAGPSPEATDACTADSQPAGREVPASFADLVDRMAAALTCAGPLAHIAVTVESERAGEIESAQGDYWIDMSRAVAREEPIDERGSIEPEAKIIRDDGVYYTRDNGDPEREPPPDCLGKHLVVISALIDVDCLIFGSGAFHVELEGGASFNGRTAISAMAAGYFPGGPDEEDVVDLVYTLYIDAATYLPLGTVLEYHYVYSPQVRERTETTFDVTFVPASTVAADFFEPSSVGYLEPDPLAELDGLDGKIYWLGEEFDGTGDLPALVLDGTWSPAGLAPELQEDNTYIGIVYYRDAEDPFGIDVALHEYYNDPASVAYFREPTLISGECLAERREVEISEGEAFVYGIAHRRDSSECGEATHYVARAFFEESHVTIIVDENTDHPFDSAEAMEHLLRGLRRRE